VGGVALFAITAAMHRYRKVLFRKRTAAYGGGGSAAGGGFSFFKHFLTIS
jgi:hypothetical protein